MPELSAGALGMDELLEVDPEPCQFCTGGIRWMLCADGEWRCRNCVTAYIREHDLDRPVSPVATEPEVDLRPTPAPQEARRPADEPGLPFSDA